MENFHNIWNEIFCQAKWFIHAYEDCEPKFAQQNMNGMLKFVCATVPLSRIAFRIGCLDLARCFYQHTHCAYDENLIKKPIIYEVEKVIIQFQTVASFLMGCDSLEVTEAIAHAHPILMSVFHLFKLKIIQMMTLEWWRAETRNVAFPSERLDQLKNRWIIESQPHYTSNTQIIYKPATHTIQSRSFNRFEYFFILCSSSKWFPYQQ